MRGLIVALGSAFLVAILAAPYMILLAAHHGFGVRVDPESEKGKRNAPVTGGLCVLIAIWIGYIAAHLISGDPAPTWTASGWLILFLITFLGLIGFADDIAKLRAGRNRGINRTARIASQLIASAVFAALATHFSSSQGVTPASTRLSFARDIATVSLGVVGFVVFACVLTTAWSNAVALTGGLEGFEVGASAMVLSVYVVIAYTQFRKVCVPTGSPVGCYVARDPLDLAVIAAAGMGAAIGVLWWNATPARTSMGNTGSSALGGLLAGMSILSRTELLLLVTGGVFVVEAVSVLVQIIVFRSTGRRVFRMAPFHHHFEMGGWAESAVIIRFWLLAAICAALGLALFYSDWLKATGWVL
jgi:phospho-N-acetylmuramoyl-pentapeptide-transferase